jgi:hypothetical protein
MKFDSKKRREAMNNPYEDHLSELGGKQVTIHRDGASDVTGEVISAADGGCTIKQPGSRGDSAVIFFVAYRDIRGVSHEDWDLGT